jgi:hypothetical protein
MTTQVDMVTTSPAAPPAAAGRLAGFTLVCLQLGLVLLVVRLFDVAERNHFFPVLCIAAGGFLVHAWLPARLRAPFFVLLSLGTILFVLGWPDGRWVLAIGGGLVALCYLPVPFAFRVALVALAGLGLAVLRMDHEWPFWPLLGSLFMFRMIVFLHDLRRADRPPLPLTLAYFFPLPNVSFLFFPILDFKTFRETYQPDAPWTVPQDGITYMVRGLSHLLLYRVVKYYVLPAPHELGDVGHAALFLAANYALYLHVSGYFHIITGVFHLFGFGLPRTHHYYFLASSFTDVWRRINIYWKDFMTKVFFLPAFFVLRGWGTRTAATAAVLWVFLATWLLHTYQVFWLTGSLPLSLYDAGLWLAVAVLVAWNLQRDLARASRGPVHRETTVRSALGLSLRVVGMFALISLFWACWNTPAVLPTLQALPATDPDAPAGVAAVLGVLLIAVAAGVAAQFLRDRLTRLGLQPLRITPVGSALAHAAVLAAAAVVALPDVAETFGPRAAGVVAALRRESATPVEAAQAVQGYYEEATAARVPAGAWLAALEGRPKPPEQIYYTEMTDKSDDFLERELKTNWSGEVAGTRLTTNRFAMRDRADRSQAKPPDTRRIAVVGSSVVMGYGVGDDETFPRLLEDRLNADRRPGSPRIEVLNFGTGMSYAIHRHVLIDRKVFAFEPDAIYYVAHQDELLGTVRHLAKLLANRRPLPYPCLAKVVEKAGITPDTPPGLAEARLQPLARDVVLGVYRDLAAECRRRGVKPVWVYLPMPGVVNAPARSGEFAKLAAEAGFVVADLSDWANGRRPAEVKLGEQDPHANALGHRLIADRLAAEIARRPELLPE